MSSKYATEVNDRLTDSLLARRVTDTPYRASASSSPRSSASTGTLALRQVTFLLEQITHSAITSKEHA